MAVVIETTLGDLTVDLFVNQRPITCLNFLKLCKIKYYNFNLFHTIQHGFIAQTGDPTGKGDGGESIWGILESSDKRYFEGEQMPKIKHTRPGLLSMVGVGNGMLGSQFFFTLASDLTSLDGQHCVIGEVTEGLEILRLLNETICDSTYRPYRDVRITHTVILEDPFNDPKPLRVPSRSPSPSAERLAGGRIAPDEELDETIGKTDEEIEEMIQAKEAKARATILEIVGDLPDADMAPPENVLFVCKLNPVTSDDDLEIIFSRFGKINSCEVIRDKKTGDSLQYAFIEFDNKKSCEDAYFKMDNVLIDDRRIHVDFSQSVSKIKWRGKGRGVIHMDSDGKPIRDETFNKEQSKKYLDDKDVKESKHCEKTKSNNNENKRDSYRDNRYESDLRDSKSFSNTSDKRRNLSPNHHRSERYDSRAGRRRSNSREHSRVHRGSSSNDNYQQSRDSKSSRNHFRSRSRDRKQHNQRRSSSRDNPNERHQHHRQSRDKRSDYNQQDNYSKDVRRDRDQRQSRDNQSQSLSKIEIRNEHSSIKRESSHHKLNYSPNKKQLHSASSSKYASYSLDKKITKSNHEESPPSEDKRKRNRETSNKDVSHKKRKQLETNKSVNSKKKKQSKKSKKKRSRSSSSSSDSSDDSTSSSSSSEPKKKVKRKKKGTSKKYSSSSSESSDSSSSDESTSSSNDSGHEALKKKSKTKKSVCEKTNKKKKHKN